MRDRPHTVNNHQACEAVYAASQEYLEAHPPLRRRIATHLWAYHQIGMLVPQTTINLFSGHFFPYSESYYELESSYELAQQGFYTYALAALRSVLELGLLGVYFAVQDVEHLDVRPWITSQERTPGRKAIFDRLRELPTFRAFDDHFGLVLRLRCVFDSLDRFVHTRGYKYSSRALTHANLNLFSEKSLELYCERMAAVVRNLIVVMLLKYLIGMQALPITEKYGMNGPAGGFLEEHDVELIKSVIHPEESDFLQDLSDTDTDVQNIVEGFARLPDLTEEQWQQQLQDWGESFPGVSDDIRRKLEQTREADGENS